MRHDPTSLLLLFWLASCSSTHVPPRLPVATRHTIEAGTAARQESTPATQDAAQLAQQLANPVASLISVPLQLNYDRGIGPLDDGTRTQLNIQPVVPFEIDDDWNVTSRTILPIVSQDEIFPNAGDQLGTGDVLQSLFFSPKQPTSGGWIVGAGPALLLPTGSERLLTADKWAAGPTAVALRQQGPWTYGALANHLWSYAGDDDRPDVNATFVQPFIAYNTPTAWTFTVNAESTYDWRTEDLALPINLSVSHVMRIGSQLVSIGGGVRYWAESADNGPEDFGFRLVFTLLFPR